MGVYTAQGDVQGVASSDPELEECPPQGAGVLGMFQMEREGRRFRESSSRWRLAKV
jgi:hypothetical protein